MENNRDISIEKYKYSFKHKKTNTIDETTVLHFHNKYEILYFVSGNVNYFIDGVKYHLENNSILLIKPNVLHGFEQLNNTTYDRYYVHFDLDMLSDQCKILFSNCFNNGNVVYKDDYETFSIAKQYDMLIDTDKFNKDLQPLLFKIRLEYFISQIYLLTSTSKWITPTVYNSIVDDIVEYINNHFAEKITLDDLAKHFHLDKYYLSTLFKKSTGFTIMNYVTKKRISCADLLLEQGKSPMLVSQMVGYNDYSVFYKAYKKITNNSPRK